MSLKETLLLWKICSQKSLKSGETVGKSFRIHWCISLRNRLTIFGNFYNTSKIKTSFKRLDSKLIHFDFNFSQFDSNLTHFDSNVAQFCLQFGSVLTQFDSDSTSFLFRIDSFCLRFDSFCLRFESFWLRFDSKFYLLLTQILIDNFCVLWLIKIKSFPVDGSAIS